MHEPPIHWNDHDDIAQKLYERFGDEFNEGKIYRIRFTELLEWALQIPGFSGKREESTEGHLEMIQSAWVYEWRDNQKKSWLFYVMTKPFAFGTALFISS